MIAFNTEVIKSRSSIVKLVSPRARTAARVALISARIFTWYSGCFASSHNIHERVLAVVSWPANVRLCICAVISVYVSWVFGFSDALALTGETLDVNLPLHNNAQWRQETPPRILMTSFFPSFSDTSPVSSSRTWPATSWKTRVVWRI